MKTNISNKHILFLARWYPHRDDPMPGLFTRYHAHLVAEFAEISVIYLHGDDSLTNKFDIIRDEDSGVNTIRVYYRTVKCKIPGIAQILKVLRFLMALSKGFKEVRKQRHKIDLIHVHVLTRLGLIALILKKFRGIPYGLTEHWSRYLDYVDTFNGFFRKKITQWVVKNAEFVTTPTENLRNAMLSHQLLGEYQILPNVVDTEIFKPAENKRKKNGDKKRFLHVSCFEDRSKNITGIIEVLKELSLIRDDWVCDLVGEGEDFQKLKTLSDKMQLTDRFIFFKGLLEGQELVEAYQRSCFLLMFSNYENLPVVINEAFACGLPVISSDVGGIGEVINDERGILIKRNDKQELLTKLIYILDHIESYNSENISNFAVRNFSKRSVGEKLRSLYEETLRN